MPPQVTDHVRLWVEQGAELSLAFGIVLVNIRLEYLLNSSQLVGLPMAFDESLLEHADRYWEAQRENAARLTTRGTFTMTGLAALFGLGLYRIEWFRAPKDILRIENGYVAYSVKILLILGLIFFIFSFLLLMRSCRMRFFETFSASFGDGKNDRVYYGTASDELRFSPDEVADLPKKDKTSAQMLIFIRTYKAAEELRRRNMLRAKHQHRANLMFSIGLGFVAVAILLYIIGSEPAIIG